MNSKRPQYPPEDSRALPGAERPTSPPPPKKRNPEVTVGHSQEYVNMLNAYIRKLKNRLGEYECPNCGEKDREENRYTHPVSGDVVCFQCGELWE